MGLCVIGLRRLWWEVGFEEWEVCGSVLVGSVGVEMLLRVGKGVWDGCVILK